MEKIFSVETSSPQQTMLVGEKLANTVNKGVVFTLKGDLGAGKTHFVKGFVNISTRGIALKVGKSFFFYNKLCLKKDPVDLYLPAAIVLKDGTILPAMVEVNGKDQPYYISIERKDNDVLSYKPLRGDIETMSFTVKQMKDYCLKEKITGDNVPFLKFNEVNKVTINKR